MHNLTIQESLLRKEIKEILINSEIAFYLVRNFSIYFKTTKEEFDYIFEVIRSKRTQFVLDNGDSIIFDNDWKLLERTKSI